MSPLLSSNKRQKGLNVNRPHRGGVRLDHERRILLHSPVVCQLLVWHGPWRGHGDAQQPGGGRSAGLKQKVLLLLALGGEFSVQDVLSKIVLLPVHRRGRWLVALLRNVTSITKCSWKCRCCRVCFGWGSRTPGGGASSRWLPAAGQGLVSNLSSSLPGGGPPGWLSAVGVTSIVQASPHLLPKKLTQTPISTPKSTPKPEEKIIPLALEGNHYVDGVCLSEHNLHQIKSLQAELASGNQSYSCNLSRHWTRTTEFWSRSNQP
ncbi:uncharacterized protein LOC120430889 [Culex pipiens pallens]|uniref:uncharacterized protein LOC120430889 n=1 Tax=Culex pipiens pallens TaxID=42434 RepID=UPI0022AA30F0|nr:uncharacterized protein LOC120430889 [Culex pipiens pallens]